MTSEYIQLRPCQLSDLNSLVEIYYEGFRHELTFFFKRFRGCFFEALFRLLVKDTIVAESRYDLVGFVTIVLGLRPLMGIKIFQLILKLPVLLASAKPDFFIYILQKLRNTDWSESLAGIACIAVRTKWRSKGIGRALMREALARYPERDAILDVRPWNESAIRLYASVDFRRTGAWKDPLGQWVVMRRSKFS